MAMGAKRILALVLLLAACRGEAPPPAPPPAPVRVAAAEQRAVPIEVGANGTVEANGNLLLTREG